MIDLLKDKLATVDDLLLQALRELFDERIAREKPEVLDDQDNALLGERYRAYEKAKELIEKSFKDIDIYRVIKKTSNTFNKGK